MGKLFLILLIGLFLFAAGCMQPGPGVNNTAITTDSKLAFSANTTESVSPAITPTITAARKGAIAVVSHPDGAAIYFDGVETGVVTPNGKNNLSIGPHQVTVRLAGYYEAASSTWANSNGGGLAEFLLVPDQGGSISVTSSPDGAVIYLDDIYQGKTTNTTLGGVIPGSHRLLLHHDGYMDAIRQVAVNPAQVTSVSIPLIKSSDRPGNISISSTPKRAMIDLDGTDTRELTNTILSDIYPGVHSIVLHYSGYPDSVHEIAVIPDQTVYIDANLYRPSTVGIGEIPDVTGPPMNNTLVINSTPRGATVYLNRNNTRMTTNDSFHNLFPVGQLVGLHLDGYYDSSQRINAHPNRTGTVYISLIKATTGSISVYSKPAGARISLDNVATSKITPGLLADVSPGEHTIILTLPGYYPAVQQVNVTSGQVAHDYAVLAENPDSPDRPKPATPVPTYGENSWVPEPVGLATSFPEYPRTMMVYRVIPEDPGEKLGELSEKFNISGDLKMYDTRWIIEEYNSTNQERYELSIDLGSGYFEYVNSTRYFDVNPLDSPEFVPDDDQARRIGEEYLKNTGLLPDDALFNQIWHGGGESHVGNITTISKTVVISYMRKLNGTIVNDRMSVMVGGGGDILRVSGHWPKIEPYKEIPLITPEEAFKELQKNVTYGNVTNISLEYYSGALFKKSDYILPVYVFRGMGPGMCDGPQPFEYKIIATQIMNESGAIQRYSSFY